MVLHLEFSLWEYVYGKKLYLSGLLILLSCGLAFAESSSDIKMTNAGQVLAAAYSLEQLSKTHCVYAFEDKDDRPSVERYIGELALFLSSSERKEMVAFLKSTKFGLKKSSINEDLNGSFEVLSQMFDHHTACGYLIGVLASELGKAKARIEELK